MQVPYTLTQEEVDEIIRLNGQSVFYLAGGGDIDQPVHEAWKRIGDKYKFKWRTVEMDGNKGARYILAEPSWKIL